MKYYLKQIITTTDGVVTDEKKYTYDDENLAMVRFHSMMASNMNDTTIATCTLMIVVDDGKRDLYVMRSETYRKLAELSE